MPKLEVKVVPNADKDEIVNNKEKLIIKVSASPERNKANVAVLKLLSKHFGSDARIVAGFKSRKKIIEY